MRLDFLEKGLSLISKSSKTLRLEPDVIWKAIYVSALLIFSSKYKVGFCTDFETDLSPAKCIINFGFSLLKILNTLSLSLQSTLKNENFLPVTLLIFL